MTESAAARPKIEYCIFDMDGLLIDTERIYTDVTNVILAKYGLGTMSWEVKGKIMGKNRNEAGQYILDTYPELAKHLTVEAYLDQREVMQDELWRTVQPMAGAVELIELLQSNKIPFALATGSHLSALRTKTSHLPHLFSHFESTHILTADSKQVPPGRGKPCPDIFLAAARSLGREVGSGEEPENEEERKERAKGLVFEDALLGLQAGIRAGMSTIWVPDAGLRNLSTETHGASQTLKSLEEFNPSEWGLPGKTGSSSV